MISHTQFRSHAWIFRLPSPEAWGRTVERTDFDQLEKACGRLGEAVLDPATWPALMEQICRSLGAAGAILLQTDARTPDVPRTEAVD
jgi:hypothetical protein